MSDVFYQAYTLPDKTIYKSNPQAKPPIGFHRPSSLATKEIITRK